MQDSDPRPASNRRPTLKSIAVSHFRKSTCSDVTDVCPKWNYNGEAIRTDSRWGILDDKREKKTKTVRKDQNAETFSNYINWSSETHFLDERCYQRIFETFVPLLCHKSIKSAYILLFSLYIQLSTRLVISLVPNKDFPLMPLLLEQCTTYPPRMFLHFGLSWLFSFSFLFCHQESLIWNLFLSLLHYSFISSIRQWRHYCL
jgi:hypothetical protein